MVVFVCVCVVYNCSAMSNSDCSRCLALSYSENTSRYNCRWCHFTCRSDHLTCSGSAAVQCPPPHVTAVRLYLLIVAKRLVFSAHGLSRCGLLGCMMYHACSWLAIMSNYVAISLTSTTWRSTLTLTLTLIHPASNWAHWITLRRHPCLSRAATSASSQVNPIFHRSLLTTPLQFALGRPGPLLYPGTCQYSACCGMRWWSIRKTCPSQRKSSFS